MEVEFRINGVIKSLDVAANESLLAALRREGYYSVKHGCETGECGACTVLIDGVARPSCVTFAAQVGGCTLTTVESLGNARKLHPIQEAFIATGAIQCGLCTPGMVISAYALLKNNPNPTEDEVRDALSGNLCRCTGYVKPVQAVLRAAAVMRGETMLPISRPDTNENFQSWDPGRSPLEHTEHGASGPGAQGGGVHGAPAQGSDGEGGVATLTGTRISTELSIVGKAERKVDAVKLVTGKPAYVDDIELRDMLHGRLLTSPHAHAVIRDINVSEARALPGVVAAFEGAELVAGMPTLPTMPLPGLQKPERRPMAVKRVRYVGDPVAVIVAENLSIAEDARELVEVDYEMLPAVADLEAAIESGAPLLYDELDSNIAFSQQVKYGDIDAAFAKADGTVSLRLLNQRLAPSSLEPRACLFVYDPASGELIAWLSSQAIFRARDTLATFLGMDRNRILVFNADVGGAFGAKNNFLGEEIIAALLAVKFARPVKWLEQRSENLQAQSQERGQVHYVEAAYQNDGRLLG